MDHRKTQRTETAIALTAMATAWIALAGCSGESGNGLGDTTVDPRHEDSAAEQSDAEGTEAPDSPDMADVPATDQFCGNGLIDGTEACDGSQLGGKDCTSVPGDFAGGDLRCSDTCTFDTSRCVKCGNDVREATEQCDGDDVGYATCTTVAGPGYTGDLACTTSCTFDPSGCTPPPFPLGNVYIAGSRNAQVFEYSSTLEPISQWTDPSFGTVLAPPGQDYFLGPAGMTFDDSGFLVVAGASQFCVFSKPNELLGCHDKVAAEPTENVIFDLDGNIYTTTSTGGTDQVRKYDAAYNHVADFTMPTGNLTGITCDPDGNLYIASQAGGNPSAIYKVDKTSLAVLDTIPIAGSIEGLQFANDGNILVALSGGVGIQRVAPSSPTVVVDTIPDGNLYWPVPLTTDNDGNIYTADYENGSGTAPADLFVFAPDGTLEASRLQSEVWGPFGMVVAGAVLPCGAYHPVW